MTMKRMMMTMLAAVLVSTSVMAQDEKTEKREPRKFDKTEMVKHRTNETVSKYKLSDKQAKQLLELNTKYADKMGPRGPHHPGGPGAGRPPMPPKDDKAKRPEPPKDDAKMKEHRQEMEKTMKAYDAELKKIMTAEQYKAYQADRQKFHKKEKVAK
jgi:Spy/CpxP family protein refolding chaperone